MGDDIDENRGLPALVPEVVFSPALEHDLERAEDYQDAARSWQTTRAYASDWTRYEEWCAQRGCSPLPSHPTQVAAFIAAEADAGFKSTTIERRVASICHYHRLSNLVVPTAHPQASGLRETLKGVRRELKHRKVQKAAAGATALHAMLAEIKDDNLRAKRDRAILAIGMAAALRRSEIVALDFHDIQVLDIGINVTIQSSKTDQEGEGDTIAVPEGRKIRPKALLLEWVDAAGVRNGPLFRRLTRGGLLTGDRMSDRSIARLVKLYAGAAGYDPSKFSAHSLRAGFLTEAASQGATIFKMQEVSRHKSIQVLSEYVRSAERFKDHAGEAFL